MAEDKAAKAGWAAKQFPSLSMTLSSGSAWANDTAKPANSPLAASAEEAGQARTRETALAFGTLIGALMRSPRHRKMKLQDIEVALIQPLLLGQFVIAHAPIPDRPGETAPVGALWWALVSPEVDARLRRETSFPLLLQRDEWRSGEIPWIVDAAGQPAILRSLIDEVSSKALGGVRPKLPPTALA